MARLTRSRRRSARRLVRRPLAQHDRDKLMVTVMAEPRRFAGMGWAAAHIERLLEGQTVSFRPRGNSMTGKINSGDLCTVEPARADEVGPGDIVLCKVKGTEYLHFVKAVGPDGRVQIGNAHGRINGWTRAVFGKLVRVER